MKTSVMHVHDMLSVLSVAGVEERIGQVPGVDSVTVNFAAGSATVRYDETRLDIADIKSALHQQAYASAAPPVASAGDGHQGHAQPVALPQSPAPVAEKPLPASVPAPISAAPKSPSSAVDATSPDATPAGDAQQEQVVPEKS